MQDCGNVKAMRPRGSAALPQARIVCEARAMGNAIILGNAPSSDHQPSEHPGIVPSDHRCLAPKFGPISCSVVRLPS